MKTDKDIDINEYSEIFKALAHPTRLTIAYNLSTCIFMLLLYPFSLFRYSSHTILFSGTSI